MQRFFSFAFLTLASLPALADAPDAHHSIAEQLLHYFFAAHHLAGTLLFAVIAIAIVLFLRRRPEN